MKFIDLFGLTYTSATNLFPSMTAGVLFDASQTTLKSVIPLRDFTSARKGSTAATKFALVKSSLNSNSWNLAAVAIAFYKTMNNLLTLILSKALGLA